MKTVQRTNSQYTLRNRGGRRGNREHSAPVAATPPTPKVCHPCQLLPGQWHIHLVDVKYCETPGPRISSRPPSRSTVTSVTVFQGP
eukprot:1139015-Pelagomonas_calceolata.AAC.2